MIFRRCSYVLILFTFICSGYGPIGKKEIRFNNTSFKVETAHTKDERARGLMFREYLPPDSGMLFIFEDERVRSFTMENTHIPLDLIWMNENKRVVFMRKNAQPATGDDFELIRPKYKAMYVLELNAGSIDEIGLRTGDVLTF